MEPDISLQSASTRTDRLALVVVGVLCISIGTAATTCRVFALWLRRRECKFDDVAMFIAYITSLVFAAASYLSLRWGAGLPAASTAMQSDCVKTLYAVEWAYFVTLLLTKLSILCLYLRFASEENEGLRRWCFGLIVALLVQFVATAAALAFQCVPLQKYWSPDVQGHCINITAFLCASNAFTVVTDIAILILPIPTVWNTKLAHSQKVAVTYAFLAGGISTIFSCVRLYSIPLYAQSDDRVRDAIPINIWSFVELNIAMSCASVAVIKSLFRRQLIDEWPGTTHTASATHTASMTQTASRSQVSVARWPSGFEFD